MEENCLLIFSPGLVAAFRRANTEGGERRAGTEAGKTSGHVLYPDLQALDLGQVSFLSLLQPPPLRILLLGELHLSGETRWRRGG